MEKRKHQEIRNYHSLTVPKVGVGFTWVKCGDQGRVKRDLLGALVMVRGLECGFHLIVPVGTVLET